MNFTQNVIIYVKNIKYQIRHSIITIISIKKLYNSKILYDFKIINKNILKKYKMKML